MFEIFGKQEGELKYSGFVDCKTGEEFDEKLPALKLKWDEREDGLNEGKFSFYDWFAKYKVWCHILFIMYITEEVISGRGEGCNLHSIQFWVNFRCQIKI